jgi:hypothetical protein
MEVSISIVDYIGKVKNGVAVLLSLNIDDKIYQMIFWFNSKSKYVLTTDEKLTELLNITTIYEYEHLEDLLMKIFTVLPPVKDLFEKFEI